MIRILLLYFCIFLSCASLMAQEITQTVKGRVTDKQSKFPIAGVTIVIANLVPVKSDISNADGEFKISGVPIGRHTLRISSVDYHEIIMQDVLVTSGKEVVLNIEMEERIIVSEEVIIVGKKEKTETNNEMTSVSARSFTIEETSRYAGSLNDPARMATNYAGVYGTSDARNDIIIRGNSPLGLLWRLEGVDIPSPNHFGSFGTTGGAISILNYNQLARSDFMTSAFPAQYGNAVAGVFDLQMRRGNNEKREYMGQIGFNGLEAGIEGPFAKSSRASYMANYRYSTLGVFRAMGINFGTSALPEYQDVSFKMDLPTPKAGKFSLFGIGGISSVSVRGSDVDSTDLFTEANEDIYFKTRMGAIGISNIYFFNNTTFAKTIFAVSGTGMIVDSDSLPRNAAGAYTGSPVPQYRNHFSLVKYSLNYTLNKKYSARNSVVSGLILERYEFQLVDSTLIRSLDRFITLRNFKGSSYLSQAFSQWQHRFTDDLTLNLGLHFQHFAFNNTAAIEPRGGIRYKFRKNNTLSLGYGLHSQLQTFQVYFREMTLPDGSKVMTNQDLKMIRSHQLVLAWDRSLGKNMRVKAESYYQYIYNAAVEKHPSSFSMLNAGGDFEIPTRDSLVNEGTGRNYGLEMTLEKFYSDNYYFLFTASLYDSKYRGSDDILRNTAFNGHYIFNLLGGKEFRVKDKNAFALDLRITWGGGRRYTPIDLEASRLYGREVRIEDQAWSQQLDDYFRVDVKALYRLNGKKVSQEWLINVQNVFNRKNPFVQRYVPEEERVIIVPQLGIFPVAQYRITF